MCLDLGASSTTTSTTGEEWRPCYNSLLIRDPANIAERQNCDMNLLKLDHKLLHSSIPISLTGLARIIEPVLHRNIRGILILCSYVTLPKTL